MMSSKIKALSIGVAAAALIATPAIAGKAHKKKTAPNANTTQTQPVDGKAIYSWDGRYRGWDPDANIRFQLLRDQNNPHD